MYTRVIMMIVLDLIGKHLHTSSQNYGDPIMNVCSSIKRKLLDFAIFLEEELYIPSKGNNRRSAQEVKTNAFYL